MFVRGGGRGGSAGETLGLGGAGWLPSWRVVVLALLRIGGLFTVCRPRIAGRDAGGGGGAFLVLMAS